jgi:hypothetical protein
MNRFEDELKQSLARVEPPTGFIERVLARTAQERNRPSWRRQIAAWFTGPQLAWAAAAALVLLITAGIGYQREMARRAAGKQAKEQVIMALRITAEEIQVARQGVRSLNR